MRHGSRLRTVRRHTSVPINYGICCSVLMHSSKGDSFSEVMEQKCRKQSSEVQTDTSVLCFWLAVPNTACFTVLQGDTSLPTVSDM